MTHEMNLETAIAIARGLLGTDSGKEIAARTAHLTFYKYFPQLGGDTPEFDTSWVAPNLNGLLVVYEQLLGFLLLAPEKYEMFALLMDELSNWDATPDALLFFFLCADDDKLLEALKNDPVADDMWSFLIPMIIAAHTGWLANCAFKGNLASRLNHLEELDNVTILKDIVTVISGWNALRNRFNTLKKM